MLLKFKYFFTNSFNFNEIEKVGLILLLIESYVLWRVIHELPLILSSGR
jgi:hypothetical protein